jgi:hypothetical protein
MTRGHRISGAKAGVLSRITIATLSVTSRVAMLLVTAVLRRLPMNFRQLPALQQGSNSPQENQP